MRRRGDGEISLAEFLLMPPNKLRVVVRDGLSMGGEEEPVPAAVVALASAKGVKDALKSAGWLDQSHKPTSLSEGLIAFPLRTGSIDAVRMAVAAGEPEAMRSVAVRMLDLGCVAVKKKPPPQKPPKQAGLAPPPSKPKAAPQERFFGRGRGSGVGGGSGGSGETGGCRSGTLPQAASVRRVACPPGVDAQWLQERVFCTREPVVLTGLKLGPCHGGWSAERLAAARCSAPKVSLHVCASSTVDLAGHRTGSTLCAGPVWANHRLSMAMAWGKLRCPTRHEPEAFAWAPW